MTISELDELYGTEAFGRTKDERLTKCYEIAGYALTLGTAPKDAILVHGSIHHVRVPQRINHAWLILPNHAIWEPISTITWSPTSWLWIVRPELHQEYTQSDARDMIMVHMHWGPWKDDE